MIDGSQRQDDNGGEGGVALTAERIAETVAGRLLGDHGVTVSGVAALDRAGPEHLSFFGAAKYAPAYTSTRAGIVLVAPDLVATPSQVAARVVVEKPQEAMLALLPLFHRAPSAAIGVHPTAVLGRGVRLGRDVSIGPYAILGMGAVIGDGTVIDAHVVVGDGVRIGARCHVYPSVTLYAGARLGDRVILHSGVRIASDGFGYVQREGQHLKIPHVGRCIVEDDVEIGSNTTIDRGSIDDTVIGAGTKIDNLVQIGHNVRVGKLCLIMSQAGIAGSTRVEDGCMILGQVGVAGHVTIGAGARLAAQAGVFGDIPAGETWSGYPARPHKEALRAQAALFKLPRLLRRIERLLESKPETE